MDANRRNFLRTSGLVLGAGLLPMHKMLVRALALPEDNMQLLRKNVGIFTERGGTIGWMIDGEGIVVVDTQFPESAAHFIEQMKEKADRQVDLLLNTHHHGDHTAGNIAFKGIAKKVVAHQNCRANQERVAKERDQESAQLYADTLFDREWSQKVGGEIITAKYFGAAHTNGDAVIHFENANVAHLGDLLFNRRHPFIDRSAGASVRNWIAVLEKIRKTYDKDTIFIFGHSLDPEKVYGRHDDLEAKENYLSKLLTFVQKEVKAGKSKEEILNATAIPGAEEWQGGRISRSLQAAYEEVTED